MRSALYSSVANMRKMCLKIALLNIPMLIYIKGNLAHKFMIFYFLCLSFHVDISNTLITKNIENTG